MTMKKIEFDKADIRDGILKKFEEVNPGALHVFLILAAHSEDDKVAEVGVERIRKLTGFSPHKVNECLTGLEDQRLIKKLGTSRNRKYEIS